MVADIYFFRVKRCNLKYVSIFVIVLLVILSFFIIEIAGSNRILVTVTHGSKSETREGDFKDKIMMCSILSFFAALMIVGMLTIITLQQTYIVSKGKIVKSTRFLCFSRKSTFQGTHIFLREEIVYVSTNHHGRRSTRTYHLYVGQKFNSRGRPKLSLIISDSGFSFLEIPCTQSFILGVAKKFESDEIFEKSIHFYTHFDYNSKCVYLKYDQTWNAPYKPWGRSCWSMLEESKTGQGQYDSKH